MSDIWERKVRTHFRRKDLDKDGVISRKDFVGMAESFADKEKFDPVQRETARKSFDALFSRYVMGSGGDNNILTEDMVVENLRKQRDDPAFKKILSNALQTVLTSMDTNNDGFVDPDEYRRFFENCGIVESDFTKAAFIAIDTNHDGKLSFEEFINAFDAYMCSDDESTTAVFGLLI